MALDCDLRVLQDHCKSTIPSTNCTPSYPSSAMKIHPGIYERYWLFHMPHFGCFFLHHSLMLAINIPNLFLS